MKRLITVVFVSLAFVTNIAFAATPVAEPKLPADIAKWEKQEFSCTKNAGKSLGQTIYVLEAESSVKFIIVMTLNGQKIAQSEESQSVTAPPTFVQYVRNSQGSPGKNWTAYTENEAEVAITRFLAEIGLTREQFMSCSQ